MSKKIPPPLPSGNPEKRNNSAQINDSKITYWFIPPEIGALPIPLIQKNILGVVATFTRNGGECWATDTQFGEAFQWSRQKVNAAINGMVAAGWLRKDVTRLSNGTTPRRLWLAQLPVTLSPTVTSSTVEPMDLVTHGDYPCHLRGLHLSPTVTTLVTHGDTNSNIIKKEKVIKNTVADALTPPTLAESATPSPSSKPKPKTKAKKKACPDEGYWTEAFPSILDWMKAKGFNGSEAAAKSWFDQCVERMRDACEANPTKYRYDNWEAAFKNWYRDRLPRVRESGLTDKELDYLFDFVWSDVRGDPVIPEAPMIDDEEVTLIKNVLVSMFDVEYEKTMKEKNADEKRFYIKQFKEKYEQAIKNKRKQNGR